MMSRLLRCFDMVGPEQSGNDIVFSYNLQKMLVSHGFKVESLAADEDGYSHCVKIENAECEGAIHTEKGRIVCIESYFKVPEE